MKRQAARNLHSAPRTSSAKSFHSFSDSRISFTSKNVGVSIGKSDHEIKLLVGVLKRMEIDRLKVSSKCLNTLPNPKTGEEEEEVVATYDGPLLSHLVGEVTEVGMDEVFYDYTVSSRKSMSHSSKKKQKPPKNAKSSTSARVST